MLLQRERLWQRVERKSATKAEMGSKSLTLALTTSVPASWMRSVSAFAWSLPNVALSAACKVEEYDMGKESFCVIAKQRKLGKRGTWATALASNIEVLDRGDQNQDWSRMLWRPRALHQGDISARLSIGWRSRYHHFCHCNKARNKVSPSITISVFLRCTLLGSSFRMAEEADACSERQKRDILDCNLISTCWSVLIWQTDTAQHKPERWYPMFTLLSNYVQLWQWNVDFDLQQASVCMLQRYQEADKQGQWKCQGQCLWKVASAYVQDSTLKCRSILYLYWMYGEGGGTEMGSTWDKRGRMVIPACPPMTGTETSSGWQPNFSATKALDLTTSNLVTPKSFLGLYVPALKAKRWSRSQQLLAFEFNWVKWPDTRDNHWDALKARGSIVWEQSCIGF